MRTRLLAHLVPDLALRDAARERLRGLRLRLAPAKLRVGDVRCPASNDAERAPAPLLDARDGDAELDCASTSTLTLRMRFCFAPTSSSPS